MKGQSSLEMMACIGLLTLFGMFMFLFAFQKTNESWSVQSQLSGLELCNGLANQLNLAGYSEGSSSYFTLPYYIADAPYTLTVYDDVVVVDYSQHSCTRRFSSLAVMYNDEYPPFNLTGGRYRINNTRGVITFEKMG